VITASIIRGVSTDAGTFGKLILNKGEWSCSTGELTWKNNDHGLSCIPTGTYHCKWINSPKHGECYQIMDVPDRSMIEIHAANFMGDINKINPSTDSHYISQLLGCIALGRSVGVLDGQMAILKSKETIADFDRRMGGNDFTLEIV